MPKCGRAKNSLSVRRLDVQQLPGRILHRPVGREEPQPRPALLLHPKCLELAGNNAIGVSFSSSSLPLAARSACSMSSSLWMSILPV
ncbi:hypothetical protein EYF80_039303 [Liparis tanakae]|uniref:Uncharacterized protein n=1 Tax=Liparis tanakae TaxID=230148 RepID=A0A4Z2GC35_9TELE|nr:hypothetical protein EYF80_039303 [Liparis tanakae]